MDKLLINKSDILVIRPTADFDDGRIEPYIREAQMYDFRPFIGDAFYFALLSGFDDDANPDYSDYCKFLNGDTYTVNTYSVVFNGAKNMISYFALARFCKGNPVHYSRYGMVKKLNQQSESMSAEEITLEYNQLKSNAISEQNMVKRYLAQKSSTFPLFTAGVGSKTTQSTGFNFFRL